MRTDAEKRARFIRKRKFPEFYIDFWTGNRMPVCGSLCVYRNLKGARAIVLRLMGLNQGILHATITETRRDGSRTRFMMYRNAKRLVPVTG